MNKRLTLIPLLLFSFIFISGTIDLNDLYDYVNQPHPNYINEDNMPVSNPITDGGAVLGRVLFYDKNLSRNNTVSCASCHQQAFAFGDPATVSVGWDGETTERHSTRLVNTRFGEETKFFWDERANTLEDQATMPIKNHVEMGFSGADGDPTIDSLITKLEQLDYYKDLFTYVYGDAEISEGEIQDALAQFVRSIQSFDSKFDVGRAQVANNAADFPNFTTEENLGKTLFLNSTQNGGANCNVCHGAPEFDIDENSLNNSVIGVANDPDGIDVTNTRSPSLRDLVNSSGALNGPMMHDGSLTTLLEVIDLYDDITVDPANTNLDNRLRGGMGGNGQNLNLTDTEKNALVAFLETLTGTAIYTAEQWSDPFDELGNLTILNSPLPVELIRFAVFGDDETAVLEWETGNEKDNEGFEIQHSRDAIDWESIGFVNGRGDQTSASQYTFTHNNPVASTNYYRLKQIDFDGRIEFSWVVTHVVENDIVVRVYPNPVVEELRVELPDGVFDLRVLDRNGRVLSQTNQEGYASFNFTTYESGIYFLSIVDETNQTQILKKIIKQ